MFQSSCDNGISERQGSHSRRINNTKRDRDLPMVLTISPFVNFVTKPNLNNITTQYMMTRKVTCSSLNNTQYYKTQRNM